MAVMNNRETFLKTEPEMDITQFAKTELDLAYADESPNQILDIFYPEDGEGPYPLVIVFHGGAFAAGHKRTHYIKSMCLPVTQGYAVATVEYRLLQEAKWPAANRRKSSDPLSACQCRETEFRPGSVCSMGKFSRRYSDAASGSDSRRGRHG